jgi:hypothetical protein
MDRIRIGDLMAGRNVKVCVLRARHDTGYAEIPDAACDAVVFSDANSLTSFWSGNTNGYLTFNGSEMKPWVDILIAAGEGRHEFSAKAYDRTRIVTGEALDGFDAFIVLLHPGTIEVPNPLPLMPGQPLTSPKGLDGGATEIDAAQRPAACLPVMASPHSFCSHEIGHTLGFKHTFGLLNNGIEYDPGPPYAVGTVYGDPYDIMSSESFGSLWADPNGPKWSGNPRFTIPVPAGWPWPGWGSAACGPARAAVHHWDPLAVPDFMVQHLPYPTQGQPHRVRISSRGSGGAYPQLIALHPDGEMPDGQFRCYLEYRSSDGWDAGLVTEGKNLSRRGLVVHTLNHDSEINEVAVFYRGTVKVPLEDDTDLAPYFTPLVVQVVYAEPHELYIDVEVTTSAPREITINPRVNPELVSTTDEHDLTTPCGDHVVSSTRTWRTTWIYSVSTRGYGGYGDALIVAATPSPVITWTINGVPVPGPAAGDGFIDVPHTAGTLHLHYDTTVDPSTLLLSDDGGARVQLPVTATATEPGGAFPLTAQAAFDTIGALTGLDDDDRETVKRCLLALGVGTSGGHLEMARFARDLSIVGAVADAADVQQAAVAALQQLIVPGVPAQTVSDLADAEHTLAVRLTEAGRDADSTAAAESAVTHYVLAAGMPDLVSGPVYCVAQLLELAMELSHHRLVDPSADAQIAGVDLWRRLTPSAADSPSQLTDFADALHNLAVRLAEASRLTPAGTAGQDSVNTYVQAASLTGADRTRIVRELQTLARELYSFALQHPAFNAQHAADKIFADAEG